MKLQRLNVKLQNLSKHNSDEKETYLDLDFIIPVRQNAQERAVLACNTDKEVRLTRVANELKNENKSLKRKLASCEDVSEAYHQKLGELKSLSGVLSESIKSKKIARLELEGFKKSYFEKEKELNELEVKFKKLDVSDKEKSKTIKNLDRKIQRREKALEEKIEIQNKNKKDFKSKIEFLQSELDSCNKTIEEISFNAAEIAGEKETLRKHSGYLKKTLDKTKSRLADVDGKDIEKLENELVILHSKVKTLNCENRQLQQFVALLQDDEVVTFHDGRYCNEIREVIMQLLQLNVSMKNIDAVIKCVLKKLANKDIQKLPSTGVKYRLQEEALIVAKLQVGEALLDDKNENNCLHGDGTSKYHRHYQNFQLTTQDRRTLSFGLDEVAGGDAASVMKYFTEAIEDLAEVI
ncbi:ERC protein 2-like [Clytia hemisphaerica]|uniref:ERC protein 2-like n=1 Tax=Clytia hemisphaerica TaxID=252671 RepID=UPI0034D616DC